MHMEEYLNETMLILLDENDELRQQVMAAEVGDIPRIIGEFVAANLDGTYIKETLILEA